MFLSKLIQKTFIQSILVFFFFFFYYWICLSKDFTEVDGPFRCFGIYHSDSPQIHGNNHLLYPVNIYLWNYFFSFFFGPPNDVLEFGYRSQLMNAFALSITLAIFYSLGKAIVNHWQIPTLATLSLGFSKAYILHGTNSAEPIVGLLWSTVSLGLISLSLKKTRFQIYGIFAAGMFLALAMATYQTMVLIGFGYFILSSVQIDGETWLISKRKAVGFLAGCVAGAAIFFGSAYFYDGTISPVDMLVRFFHLDGGGNVYGGFSISKSVNLFMGFLTNEFITPEWSGFRYYLKNNLYTAWTPWFALIGLFSGAFFYLVIGSFQKASHINTNLKWSWFVGIFFCLLGPLGWDPTYNKMWLQPLMLIMFGSLFAWKNSSRATKYSIVLVAILTGVPNLFWGYLRNPVEYKYVQPALETLEQIKPNDIIVTDWNPITIMAMSLSVSNESFPIITYAHDNPKGVTEKLIQLLKKAEGMKARLIFFGILDQSRETWDPFLGKRCGLAYEALKKFRNSSINLKRVNYKDISLRVFAIDFQKFDSTEKDSVVGP